MRHLTTPILALPSSSHALIKEGRCRKEEGKRREGGREEEGRCKEEEGRSRRGRERGRKEKKEGEEIERGKV